MADMFVIQVPDICECGYPFWSTYGTYQSKEDAEKDFIVLSRQAELNGEDKPRLLEKAFDTPSLKMPKLIRLSVLTDEEEKSAHIGKPFASVQDVSENEETFWTASTECHTITLIEGGYYKHFEFERTLYININKEDTRESIKKRAEEFVKKEGYDVV